MKRLINHIVAKVIGLALYIMIVCLSIAGMIWAIRLLVNVVGC